MRAQVLYVLCIQIVLPHKEDHLTESVETCPGALGAVFPLEKFINAYHIQTAPPVIRYIRQADDSPCGKVIQRQRVKYSNAKASMIPERATIAENNRAPY